MDTFAHGLWGGFAAGWKKRFGLAFLFGVAPDVIWFSTTAPIIGALFLTAQGRSNDHALFDWWFQSTYNITHSLVIIGVLWLVLWFKKCKIAVPFLAWPLHIVFDIFTHSNRIWLTPFLFPLSDYKFSGISWAQHWFMIANYTGLLILVVIWIVGRHMQRCARGEQNVDFWKLRKGRINGRGNREQAGNRE